MTAFAVLGSKGSPGVTTTALLLAALWPQPACLLEADPAGGDLRYWLPRDDGQPLRPDIGVVSLLAAQHTGSRADSGTDRALLAHTQLLPGGLPVLIGAGNPAQHQALTPTWPLLTGLLTHTDPGLDVVVDTGRAGPDPAVHGLLQSVPLRLLVCRPTVSSVGHARHTLDTLRHINPHTHLHDGGSQGAPVIAGTIAVVVIGSPTERDEVRTALSLPPEAIVGQLPWDPAAARALAGQWTRKLDRSPLVAAGRRLSEQLHTHLHADQYTPAGKSAGTPDQAAPPEPEPAPTVTTVEPMAASMVELMVEVKR